MGDLTLLTYILAVLGILLIIWSVKLLIQAVKLKAIKGFKDRIIVALLWFLGIIFAIIYLKVKINKKLKSPKKQQTNQTKEIKNFLKKFWWIVWKDDSFKGWLISIIFLFVIIKFIFFPVLSLATGTALPLAIVESCSMYHQGNVFSDFDNWWDRHDEKYASFMINKLDFKDFNFKRGFSKGDILFIVGVKPEKISEGDVIIFNANQANPIIHRIINIKEQDGEYTFSTIGDNNNRQLNFEKSISSDKIVGKAVFRIAPSLGWGKLIFFEANKPVSEKGFCDEN